MPRIALGTWVGIDCASRGMILAATVGLVGTGVATGSPPRIVVPASSAGPWTLLTCLAVGIAAATAMIRPARITPAAIVVAGWVTAAVAAVAGTHPPAWEGISMVPPLQSSMVAASLMALSFRGQGAGTAIVANACAAVGLLFFGVVHLAHPVDVASLLPDGAPFRSVLPLLSGTLLVACSAGVAWPKTRSAAAILAATMFLGWLPLVHAPRVAANPESVLEWQFALLALALAGALLAVASIARTRDGVTLRGRRMARLLTTEI